MRLQLRPRLAGLPGSSILSYPSKATPLLIGVFLACNPEEKPAETAAGDTDGDGYFEPDDCDDADPMVNPDAAETCNGIDDNCDNATDGADAVDAVSWYADEDGDGFGQEANVIVACTIPDGAVATGLDCDDAAATVNPNAEEVCNGVDDNCDGASDGTDAIDATTWYADGDGDGFGDPASGMTACDAPAGTVGNAEDCDDGNGSVSPAVAEVCLDGVDNDCRAADGACRNPGLVSVGSASAIFTSVEGTEGFTGASVELADLDGDGMDEVLVNASDETGIPLVSIHSGPFAGTAHPEDALARLYLGGEDIFPNVASAGDLDGDGSPDVAIGSIYNSDLYPYNGVVYVMPGPFLGDIQLPGATAAVIHGAREFMNLGFPTDVGDLNGDGLDDLLIGSVGEYSGAYLFYGPVIGSLLTTDANTSFGDYYDDGLSQSVSSGIGPTGDTDGDGVDDLLLAAASDAHPNTAAFLFRGVTSGVTNFDDADAVIEGANEESWLVTALGIPGDFTGDGLADVSIRVLAERYTPYDLLLRGLCLYDGSLSGTIDSDDGFAELSVGDDWDVENVNLAIGSSGSAIAVSRDANGDGWGDLLIGASNATGAVSLSGGAFLAYGPFAGVVDLYTSATLFGGSNAGDATGSAVAMGDVDADGLADVLVGAIRHDYEGAAYLFYGGGE